MTIKDKIEYVKNRIEGAVETSSISPVHLYLYPLTEYEDGPTLISRAEQKSIVKKLEDDGYIKGVVFDDDGVGVWFEKVASKTRRSSLLSHIKTTDELLQKRELFDKFLRIVDIEKIKQNHIYKIPTEEKNDDLIQLLIDLKVVKYDWKDMEKQTHRIVGNRIIEFEINGSDILKLYGRVSGKNTRIKKQALELISKDIGERFTFNKIVNLFTDIGVPESMFVEDTKWRAVFYILSYYTSSEQQNDYFFALKLIQETLHPLMFEGNEENIQTARDKYKKWLKYDGIDVGEDSKLYIAPTEEELELGIDEWVSIDGDVIEPKAYAISPDHISELWVLSSQLITLFQNYQNNFSADKKELEKLYLEVIGKIERLIMVGKVGKIRESYERPFTSLLTAEVEAKAKKADSPLSLISDLLLEVTSLNPSPEEIAKQLEENASLIERITSATRAITGDKIDYEKISYEQATFLLKLVFSRIFNILESISTGYINMMDERLNAGYVTLSDNLNSLLERKDMEILRQSLPEIPKHLFQGMDEVDVWWENVGQSSLMNFIGDIETMWVRTAQQTFPIPQWFGAFLTDVDNSVMEHRKTKSAQWAQMIKNVDKENKRNNPNSDNEKFNAQRDDNQEQQPILVKLVQGSEVNVSKAEKIRQPATSTNSSSQTATPETSIGKLVSYSDGSIKFDNENLQMRNQIKDLCRLFMNRADILTPIDRIREEIIKADRRKFTSFKTISKYVSELHSILQIYYKKPVIFNQKEEGWYFRPPK